MEEKEIGMSVEESEDMANFAGHLIDHMKKLSEEEKKLLSILKEEWLEYDDLKFLSPRELFVLGFLRGREFTLHQLGVFDDEDDLLNEDYDISKAPEIIKQYLKYDQQKKK